MPETAPVTQPDLTLRPLRITCERVMAEPPHVLFPAWTTDLIGSWMAVSSTVLMKLEVNAPFFFETQFDGQRHSDYGRCFRLEADRLVQMTWVNAAGTKGAETGVTIELVPSGKGTRLRLSHAGFLDEESRKRHDEAWPNVLEHLDKVFRATP